MVPGLTAMAAAAAAATSSFFVLFDANPSLYLYDKFVATERRFDASFRDKNVWITGASKGIGSAVAVRLAGHGARVALSARDVKSLEDVADRCREARRRAMGHRRRRRSTRRDDGSDRDDDYDDGVLVLPLDITSDDETIRGAVDCILERFGSVDVLFLNAGIGGIRPALSTSVNDARRMMEVNCFGPARIAAAVMTRDKWPERRRGHIVVTSSVAAKMAVPLSAPYAASKHAVSGYFSSLRSEHGSWLRVDLPCPGPVDTDFFRGECAASTDGDGHSSSDSSSGAKMPVDRCAKLIASAMCGPAGWFYESWMQRQPTLFFSYVNQYAPGGGNALLNKIGPWRVAAWEAGLPLYQASSWIKAARGRIGDDANDQLMEKKKKVR